MKNIFLTLFLAFSFISADSPINIDNSEETSECECKTEDTPDSWCRGVANRAVYDYFQANPNASHEDAWNYEVAIYSLCRFFEDQYQIRNN
ncbi:hypothetical protein [Winogradskyella sediminis]|uniref:hypothetical protein n=1 Tax=Winogradskyella sediminis TaxID=1382466 RepID=UPI003AA95C71